MGKYKISDFIDQIGDGIHGTPDYVKNGEYYFINGNNLIDGKIAIFSDTLMVSGEEYDRIKRPLGERTILLSINGTLGRVAIYKGEKVVLGKSACYINVKQDKNRYFVKYILTTKEFQKYILLVAHGSTIKNLAPSQVADYEFSIPDELDQDKVAFLLKAIDDKIESNKIINSELESMAKTIYDYWFLQFEFPNEESKPYKSSGGKMVWNKEIKREIPEKWKVDFLGNLFTSNRGISYNSKAIEGNGVPMINLASFNVDGSYKQNGIKQYSGDYPAEKVVKPFDLLMCNTQQTAIDYKKDIIGKAFLVPDIFEGDIVTSHHVTTIKVKNDNMKYFLHRLFNTGYFHKYAAGFTNGTNILGLIFSGIERYKLEVPDDAVLDKFAELMLDIEMKKSKMIKENQELISLRDFLLPLLMNGQVGFKA